MERIINRKIVDFLKPQIIYVPLQDINDNEYELIVKIGNYVYKNQAVAYDKLNEIYLFSSVSGYAVNIVSKYIKEGKSIKCLLIENDFKEKSIKKNGKKSNIDQYDKVDFINMLKTYSIKGNKSNTLTYLKYQNNPKYLLVNGVECENGLFSDKVLMLNHPEEILEGIDAILKIMNIKEGIIVLKLTDDLITRTFNKYLGTYPNIKIYGVEDVYPCGWEESIITYLLGKINKNKYVLDNVSTIYAIYEMLKLMKPQTEKVISLNGDGLKKNICVNVKMYSSFEEILYHTNQYRGDNLLEYYFVAGSLERGKSIPTDELIVTNNLEGISVIKNTEEKGFRCINCGICTNVCPVNILPNEILNKNNRLNKKNYKKCIECGLCSKSCPSKINLMEMIKDLKEEKK